MHLTRKQYRGPQEVESSRISATIGTDSDGLSRNTVTLISPTTHLTPPPVPGPKTENQRRSRRNDPAGPADTFPLPRPAAAAVTLPVGSVPPADRLGADRLPDSGPPGGPVTPGRRAAGALGTPSCGTVTVQSARRLRGTRPGRASGGPL